nr:hypothetical protein B0A51_02101 [Rachicladosporium sp. CCFEE 5018]
MPTLGLENSSIFQGYKKEAFKESPHVQNDAQDSAQNLSAQRRREARLNKLRHWGRKRLPKYSILFTELAAIAAIVGYFYGGAVDTYLKFEWKLESNIGTSMPAPAFALIGNADDAAFATLNAGWRKCRFPSFSAGSCDEHFFEKPVNWDSSPYGNISYYLFDADEEVIFGKLSDQLLLQTDVNWNSKLLEAAYDTQAPYNPSLSAIMYDSRMTEDQLRQALTCNIVVWTEQPALGSNTYTIDEVTQTYDALGKLNLTILDPDCKSLAETLYTFKEGLATYRYRVSSSSTSFAYVCDQGNTTMKYDQPCVTQIIIRYGTFSTTQLTSVPGIEIKDIFLNIAAIAGGVQFVAWFMTIFQ